MKIGSTDIVDCKIGTTQVNKIYLGSNLVWEKAGGTLLLDLYPNSAAAYSLRKLRTAYTGSAIRVRRSSDNAEQDISFVGNELDTTSLLSFVGAGDGLITTWYDQSGLGNDAIETTASGQASIVLSGVLNTTNGKAAALGKNNTAYTTGISIFNGADGTYSGFVVSKLVNAFDSVMRLTNITTGNETFRYFNTSSTTFRIQSWDSSGTSPVLITEPISANSNAISSFIRGLNSLKTSSNTLTNSLLGLGEPRKSINDVLTIMGFDGGSFGLESYFSEAILYPSDQTDNQAAIESNINSHYNIYAEDILEFNPYNIWDSEHITIDGTTTTLHDFNTFGDKYDMINPAASNQPTYNAASANFNGLPSFTFDAVSQYFKTDVVNYRNTDTSGVIVNVFRHLSGAFLLDLNYSLSNVANRYLITYINTNSYRPAISPSILRSFRGNTNIVTGSPSSVVAYADTGTSYSMNINGNSETITMISGSNDGEAWFDGNPFDTISIGGIVLSSGVLFGNLEWCMSGYFPYTDESTTLEIVNFLKNKYGVA